MPNGEPAPAPSSGRKKTNMKEVQAFFTKQIGPLPVWGWGIVLVATVILWRKIRGDSSTTTDSGLPTKIQYEAVSGSGEGGGSTGSVPPAGEPSSSSGTSKGAPGKTDTKSTLSASFPSTY